MFKFISLLFITTLILTQGVTPEVFAELVQKSAYFNKKNSDKFIVVHNGNDSFAKSVSKLLVAKQYSLKEFKGTKVYCNLIFIGLSDTEIRNVKKLSANALTYSNNVANIPVVSVVFGIKDGSSRPQIIVNLSLAKDEADFKSAFLKIAQRQ